MAKPARGLRRRRPRPRPRARSAVTTKFVGDGNVQRNGYCGVVPNELDTFADVLSGGSLTGTMCFLVPAPELTNGVLYVTAGFDTDPIYFATL